MYGYNGWFVHLYPSLKPAQILKRVEGHFKLNLWIMRNLMHMHFGITFSVKNQNTPRIYTTIIFYLNYNIQQNFWHRLLTFYRVEGKKLKLKDYYTVQ